MPSEATRAKELAGLIERVEKASGPSVLLDAELYATIGGAPHTTMAGDRRVPFIAKGDPQEYPHYTASVDAALALVERLLPGWMWYVGSVGENDMPQATITEPVEDCRDFVGHATTAPLAILLAMLKALQEPQDAQ